MKLRRIFSRSILISTLILFNGCATTPNIAFGPIFEPDPRSLEGYSKLYIYRPPNKPEENKVPDVYLNGLKVVGLKDGGYTFVFIRPGTYRISTEISRPKHGSSNIEGEILIEDKSTSYLKLDSNYSREAPGFWEILPSTLVPVTPKEQFTLKYKRWVLMQEEEGLAEIQYRRYVKPYVGKIPI